MSNSRMIGFALLAVILIAGGFAAGYLLMGRMSPPSAPPPPAAAVAATTKVPATTAAYIGPHLVIKKAVYGDLPNGLSADVTAKVAALVAHEALTVAASNDNFGDPVVGIDKKLRVDYALDGVAQSRIVAEGATLTIKAWPVRLVIKQAVYGDLPDGTSADVTAKVAAKIDNDTLTIGASNDNFGDPAENIVKKLRVDYTFDGKAKSKTVGEGEELTISLNGD